MQINFVNPIEQLFWIYEFQLLGTSVSVIVYMYRTISARVANLGDFSPINANLGIFWAFGELGEF
jgi:hypothetical protein